MAQKCTLLLIAEFCDSNGVTYKGLANIAAATNTDEHALRRGVKALEEAGLLFRYRRTRRNGSRSSNLMVLRMEREADLRVADYDGRNGARLGGRITKRAPAAGHRIVEDLAPQTTRLVAEDLAPQNEPTYRRKTTPHPKLKLK